MANRTEHANGRGDDDDVCVRGLTAGDCVDTENNSKSRPSAHGPRARRRKRPLRKKKDSDSHDKDMVAEVLFALAADGDDDVMDQFLAAAGVLEPREEAHPLWPARAAKRAKSGDDSFFGGGGRVQQPQRQPVQAQPFQQQQQAYQQPFGQAQQNGDVFAAANNRPFAQQNDEKQWEKHFGAMLAGVREHFKVDLGDMRLLRHGVDIAYGDHARALLYDEDANVAGIAMDAIEDLATALEDEEKMTNDADDGHLTLGEQSESSDEDAVTSTSKTFKIVWVPRHQSFEWVPRNPSSDDEKQWENNFKAMLTEIRKHFKVDLGDVRLQQDGVEIADGDDLHQAWEVLLDDEDADVAEITIQTDDSSTDEESDSTTQSVMSERQPERKSNDAQVPQSYTQSRERSLHSMSAAETVDIEEQSRIPYHVARRRFAYSLWFTHTVGLPQYHQSFVKAGYEDLSYLDEDIDHDELLNECGVELRPHRKRILTEIKKLVQGRNAANPATSNESASKPSLSSRSSSNAAQSPRGHGHTRARMSDKFPQPDSESPLQGGFSSANMGAVYQMLPISMDPRESDSAIHRQPIHPPPAAVSNSQYRKMTSAQSDFADSEIEPQAADSMDGLGNNMDSAIGGQSEFVDPEAAAALAALAEI